MEVRRDVVDRLFGTDARNIILASGLVICDGSCTVGAKLSIDSDELTRNKIPSVFSS